MSVQIGIIGLSTMGAALATNYSRHGIETHVFNRHYDKTQELLLEQLPGIFGYEKLEDMVNSLNTPRIIFLMVASTAVEVIIHEVTPYLAEGDILVDLGNSLYIDTIRRQEALQKTGIRYVGCGISGGEEGAKNGASFMPGGEKEAVDLLVPILSRVAAEDFQGGKCVTNVGLGGAGHLVKTIHNGIEYAIMQGIAEIYDLLRKTGLSEEQIINTFQEANSGELQSFLLECAIDVLSTKQGDSYLVDSISSVAGAKGTGQWTVQASLEYNVAVPSISAAVTARTMSGVKRFPPQDSSQSVFVPSSDLLTNEVVESALHSVFVLAYLQGYELIRTMNSTLDLQIELREVFRIWQGGCIIRSSLLENLYETFVNTNEKQILFTSCHEELSEILYIHSRLGVSVPLPVIHASFDYVTTLLADLLPTNLIQGMRDNFGAHGYTLLGQTNIQTGGWLSQNPKNN